jgi:succinyl-diaminopimelate desuccinylase
MNNYTVEEVAEKLKVSTRTVQREINRGNIKPTKAGRRYLISEDELNRYLSSYKSIKESIQQFCKEHSSDMITLLQKLVTIPSVSDTNGEDELANIIKQTMDSLGIRSIKHGRKDTVTVQGSFGYADNGILLDCPLDTTPAGDIQKWSYPPYEGVIKQGKMYGRGTADCKAGLVAMIYAVLALKNTVDESKVRVELVFDGGEQNGSYNGMKSTLKKGLPVKAGIIGYAGNSPEIAIGARGYHRYKFTAHGVSAHTGSRSRHGVNAISSMATFISEIEKIELPKSSKPYFEAGSRITFATIDGGTAINIVPDECTARVDIRTTPEFTKEKIEELFETVIKSIKNTNKDFDIEYSYLIGQDGYVLTPDESIISSLQSAISDIHGYTPELKVSGPSHIGALLHDHNIPVTVWGPRGGNVHTYDEYVEIESISTTAEVYANTILNFFDIGA